MSIKSHQSSQFVILCLALKIHSNMLNRFGVMCPWHYLPSDPSPGGIGLVDKPSNYQEIQMNK